MTAPVGISFHHRHFKDISATQPDLSFFEIHCENYMSPGGLSRQMLRDIRERYQVSAHGVGLSLGSAEGLDPDHLQGLKDLYTDFSPFIVSEHLSWSHHKKTYLNDLLPVPYTKEALQVFESNICQAQDVLQRPLLIENPSIYLCFKEHDYHETDFLAELCNRTGCGLLLDINNVFVSSFNAGTDPIAYLDGLSGNLVKQYHLAGHARHPDVYIDDHGAAVSDEVWRLFDQALERLGAHPTLIEWDNNVPDLDVLVAEAHKARLMVNKKEQEAARDLQQSA